MATKYYLRAGKPARSTANDNKIICVVFRGRHNQVHQLAFFMELYRVISSPNVFSTNEDIWNRSLPSNFFQFFMYSGAIVWKKQTRKFDIIITTGLN